VYLDVISAKVCAHIDGRRTVGEIAADTLIDVELVIRCIRHMLLNGVRQRACI
jgi:hypothetical protein